MILGKQYKNLPGMLIDFKDGGKALKFNDNTGNTDSILLLGTAIDGPVMEPVAVDDQSVESLFGSDSRTGGIPNGSTLVSAYKHMRDAGAEDIRLMRITGASAKAQIGAKSVVNSELQRVDEELGTVPGNDLTKLNLGNFHENKSDHEVFVKGIKLEKEKFSVENNILTINPGVTNAGASVMVRFTHTVVENITKEYALNGDKKIILEHLPKEDTFTATKNGVAVPKEHISIATEGVEGEEKRYVVTFGVPTRAGEEYQEGDKVIVSYSTDVPKKDQITETENKKSKKKAAETVNGVFVTASKPYSLPLKANPKDGKVILYIDNAKVLNTNSFKVTTNGEKTDISIEKKFFEKDSRISVSYQTASDVVSKRKIDIESYFGGTIYNLGLVEIEAIKNSSDESVGKIVKITKPDSKKGAGELPQTYSSLHYPTFGDLVDAINANNGVYKATTDCPSVATSELEPTGTYFSDGDDGVSVSKQAIFEALSGVKNSKGEYLELGAYHLLENYKVDTVIPLGVYADDELIDRFDNFAYELALFCAATSQRSNTVYGSIAMKPLKNVSLAGVQEYAEYLTKFDNTYLMKDLKGSVILTGDGSPIDLGKFISVVVGPAPIMRHPIPSLREANPACIYAALSATLLPQSAPTNKSLKGVTGIKYVFSDAQLDAITGNRLVTFTNRYSGSGRNIQSCIAVDGVTAAREGSEYSRLTTMKIMRDVANNTREVAEPFIGEPNTIEQRNALSALLSKRYDILIELGELISYDMNLISSATDTALGQARLELAIHAPEELRKITTVMGLKR